MRRPSTYFATVLNWLPSTNLPKTLNYIQYKVLFVTQVLYHVIRVTNEPWKNPNDVLMRRPATDFATDLKWLASTNLPKTLNHIQYTVLFVTQVLYHAIGVSNEPWKNPKDVLMRRPATDFATDLKWLVSTNLPKTLTYIQYRLLYVIQAIYHAINLINNSCKKSQGRSNETSCNIFCNRFKQIDLCKSGSLSIMIWKYLFLNYPCHYGY